MNEIKVLDHGYVRFIEAYGHGLAGTQYQTYREGDDNEVGIIEAARQSVGGGFESWEPYEGHPKGDAGLLNYLYNNKHSTPFEMAGLILEIKAPIFVFREWHRHRTQSYNEMSARYTPLPNENYIPTVERLMMNSKTNKQAGTIKGAHELTEFEAECFIDELRSMYQRQQILYDWALNTGVPKELARIHLPVGRYSQMRAAANLRNWCAFLTLRMAPNAQWEIRMYAYAVGEFIKANFPRTWELFALDMIGSSR